MINSIGGSTGNIFAISGNDTSRVSSAASGLMEALDLVSPDFHAGKLGSPRQIAAGVTLLRNKIDSELELLLEAQGETGRDLAAAVWSFIGDGTPLKGAQHRTLAVVIDGFNATDTQQTRESRMQSVVAAGMEFLESARGPGLNLLNVAARTGLVVTLTTVLRQLVGFYVEKAIREGDSPEASRAWEVAAITMIGPAMSLMGAIRDECAGTASLQSRLGRVCMASITMGALFAAHLNGASSNMLSGIINTNIYTVARDLANAFFPLQDNAGAASAGATGVTTVAFGTVQFLLAELGALMPLSGPGRYAAELGYSLGADVIQGALNATGAVIDDFIFILCRSWPLLSPSAGLGSVLSDPESLQQSVLQVRAGARLPSREQLADALLNVSASRTSAFQAINLAVAAAAVELAFSDMGENAQGHVVNVCLMAMLMLIYFPFIWSCSQRPPDAKPELPR
ncbi:hypothetical protein [Pseudomonas sp. GL-B-16]|uniref:hypothetical protein n=1 Tax=Pseudomonas sp. GL-B-16 TaxID=2832373 RepID=UPI001CC124A5|nr:hypothetical protein [Pseudomonas sp. GL-B-16]